MSNRTKIYGHCAAGCLYRVPSYNEMLSLATVFPISAGIEGQNFGNAFYLEKGKRYRIVDKGAHTNRPYKLSIVGYKTEDPNGINLYDLGWDVSPTVYFDENASYDRYTPDTIRWVFFNEVSSGHNFRIDLNGVKGIFTGERNAFYDYEDFDALYLQISLNPATAESGATLTDVLECYIYNDNATMTGKDGTDGKDGKNGKDGTTFTPNIANDVLSWNNADGKTNPPSYDIGKKIEHEVSLLNMIQLPADGDYVLEQGKIYKIYNTESIYFWLRKDGEALDQAFELAISADEQGVAFKLLGIEHADTDTGVFIAYELDGKKQVLETGYFEGAESYLNATAWVEVQASATVCEPLPAYTLPDIVTGKVYKLYVANGKLTMEEAVQQ